MSYSINETHDPNLRSWVESANDPNTDFPIQNLPFGLFDRIDSGFKRRVGIAIGDQVLDLVECCSAGLLSLKDNLSWMLSNSLSLLMQMDRPAGFGRNLRREAMELLREGATKIQDYQKAHPENVSLLAPMSDVHMRPPTVIGDYTDFYASIYHATNIGKMFRPDQPLMPNYKWVPIGYHGRASSIVVSGTPIRRPVGQTKDDNAEAPVFGPSKVLDYELEVGFFVGQGNEQGRPIKIAEAEDHIFGLCLVNDWSARDIQRWEYQPLGPFLSKSFATTISPWIVTMEALAPFRAPAFERAAGDPEPLPYLDRAENRERGGFDIKLEVFISTEQMREKSIAPHRLSSSNTRDLYWTFAQMLTHHTSNGCNLGPGDLLASGTVSGATKDSMGCLIELTGRGAEPINLPTGEVRRFLQDGDEVVFRGYCEREGFRRIGFGECRGIVTPAVVQ
ncbi:MAG TPA: fumarylacetoacetase [Blastocatellia bacterium]|jgi:fumarylacetoacetase|nr:fumarylacetoacetase [Blastocatellia bacterium]